MPVTPTYPGVYVEEVASAAKPIQGVSTSITAFVGRTLRGPVNRPVRVGSFLEYTREFGGLWRDSTVAYAVQQFFLNGGRDAIVVRVEKDAAPSSTGALTSVGAGPGLELQATSPGAWGNRLRVDVVGDAPTGAFNLIVRELDETLAKIVAEENHAKLGFERSSPRFVAKVLEKESSLVRVANPEVKFQSPPATNKNIAFANGDDGSTAGFDQIGNPALRREMKGLWALDRASIFNLLCIPPFARTRDVDTDTWVEAKRYCRQKRAFLIVDPPSVWTTPEDARTSNLDRLFGAEDRDHAAIYYPRLRSVDPLQKNQLETYAPCGAIAGVYARTDLTRGVWNAPAGLDVSVFGARELTYVVSDAQNGQLNTLGINGLRKFARQGLVVWGARTMDGADQHSSDYRYVPVRRLASFVEESIHRGTQWVVFEPNDEPLWAQIRASIDAFMMGLFQQGAFQGASPRDAFFVKCGSETTTQRDIDLGVVNVFVGFAPVRPAEFVVLQISQKVGKS